MTADRKEREENSAVLPTKHYRIIIIRHYEKSLKIKSAFMLHKMLHEYIAAENVFEH